MKGCRFQTKSLIFDEPFSIFSNLGSKIAKMIPRGVIRSSESNFGTILDPFGNQMKEGNPNVSQNRDEHHYFRMRFLIRFR